MKYVCVLAMVLSACVCGPCEEEPETTSTVESYLDWSYQFERELHEVDAQWQAIGGPVSAVHVDDVTIWRWSAEAVYGECSGAAFCHRCSADGACLLVVLDAASLGYETRASIQDVKRAFGAALGDVNKRPDLAAKLIY